MAVKRLLDGRFQLLRVISSKSYSKTYLMTDYSDPAKAKCIVKHLQLPTRNPVTLKFLNELLAKRVKILQRLGDHPALAKNLACIQEGADFYWVRAYVPGRSLQAELALNQPRSEPEVRKLLTEVLACLEVLQHHGVIHQNLHPNNLIRHQSDDHLVLVDFSLAQESSYTKEHSSDNGNSNGETNGVAPELAFASPYLPQVPQRQYPHFNADHFALGMIALRAATGLAVEALPQFQHPDFLEQFKLQLDECSTLREGTKAILVEMVSPHPNLELAKAKAILAKLAETSPQAVEEQVSLPPEERLNSSVNDEPPTPIRGTSLTPASVSSPDRDGKWRWLGLVALAIVAIMGVAALKVPQRLAAATLLRRAETAEDTGQVEQAIDYLNQIIAQHPNHASALAKRSTLLWEHRGDSNQALQDLTTAIQVQPENPDYLFQRGRIRFHVGDQQGAIADYTQALRIEKTFSDAYVNRGTARAQLGDEEGAVQDYTTALDMTDDPRVRAFAYLNRCLSLSNLQEHARALEDCTEAINLRPNNSLAYENRGLVKRRLGDQQGALQDFTIAIHIDPSNPEAYYNRALTRQDLGDLEGAIEDLDRTLALDPEHPFAYYDRGLLYVAMGETDQAIADFEQVATECLEVGRVGCFEDAQYQLSELGVATP